MAGIVSDEELRTLIVQQLELVDAAEFTKAQQMAVRLKIPLERARSPSGAASRSLSCSPSSPRRGTWASSS